MASEATVRLQAEALKSQALETQSALATAERAARAAEESASATKTLARAGQRPWVALQMPQVRAIPTQQGEALSLVVVSTLKNGGRTPALELEVNEKLELYGLPTSAPTIALDCGSTGVVGPGFELQLHPKDIRINREQFAELTAERLALFLYGACKYQDIFGDDHTTRWCLRYVPSAQAFTIAFSEANKMT